MFSIPLHHSVYEVPNFFANRISIKSRYVTKPSSQFAVRPKLVRPAPIQSSPITVITDGIKDRLKAIYPGTLWCGDGTHAKYQNEIGLFRNTDICCKQHDECPAFIKSGSEFKGLRNTGKSCISMLIWWLRENNLNKILNLLYCRFVHAIALRLRYEILQLPEEDGFVNFQ